MQNIEQTNKDMIKEFELIKYKVPILEEENEKLKNLVTES